MLLPRSSTNRLVASVLATVLAITATARTTVAQRPDSSTATTLEQRAELARRGAGISVGTWNVRGLHETTGARYTISPMLQGYYQKGLDKHLALETTVGLWRRTQLLRQPGRFGGDSSTESVSSYVIPLFTILKVYPFTTPAHRIEPYLLGGVGVALGIDDRRTSGGSGGLLGGSAQSGIALATGFGFSGGTGLEWRFSEPFGLQAGGRYRWVRFLGTVGGEDTFNGFGFDAGITYRFQY